jgi:hypothetical protein
MSRPERLPRYRQLPHRIFGRASGKQGLTRVLTLAPPCARMDTVRHRWPARQPLLKTSEHHPGPLPLPSAGVRPCSPSLSPWRSCSWHCTCWLRRGSRTSPSPNGAAHRPARSSISCLMSRPILPGAGERGGSRASRPLRSPSIIATHGRQEPPPSSFIMERALRCFCRLRRSTLPWSRTPGRTWRPSARRRTCRTWWAPPPPARRTPGRTWRPWCWRHTWRTWWPRAGP